MNFDKFRLGIERIQEEPKLAAGWGSVVLLCNVASVDRQFRPAWETIKTLLGKRLTALMGPQHGLYSTVQDNMIETAHQDDPELGLRVHSLYSETREPTDSMLQGADTIVVDLQNVGCRVYTFKATVAGCLRAAKRLQKKVVVLDRPNPIGGVVIEGSVLEKDNLSFVGPDLIPMRHGLTVGEAAIFFNQRIGAELEVVPMGDYDPTQLWNHYFPFWVPTSPNVPTFASAVVYPGMVLFEGTNLSEGRGTSLPFQLIGAPYIRSANAFVDRVRKHLGGSCKGLHLRPTRFQPTFHKWAGEECRGLELHVLDPGAVRSFEVALAILRSAMEMGEERFAWKSPPYEYEYKLPPIRLLTGMNHFQEKMSSPDFNLRDGWWRNGLDGFGAAAAAHHLYERKHTL